MKPSEVISKLVLECDVGKTLDSRFIDREELSERCAEVIGKYWGLEMCKPGSTNIAVLNDCIKDIMNLWEQD